MGISFVEQCEQYGINPVDPDAEEQLEEAIQAEQDMEYEKELEDNFDEEE